MNTAERGGVLIPASLRVYRAFRRTTTISAISERLDVLLMCSSWPTTAHVLSRQTQPGTGRKVKEFFDAVLRSPSQSVQDSRDIGRAIWPGYVSGDRGVEHGSALSSA